MSKSFRISQVALVTLSVLVWAGAATAASISVIDTVSPGVAYGPGDTVIVDVVMDGTGLPGTGAIMGMFFHVDWTANLSLESVSYNTPLPGGYGLIDWVEMAGNGMQDAYGLWTAQYDPSDRGGVFPPGTVVATLAFQVLGEGSGTAVITPFFALGDVIAGGAADGYPDFTSYFSLNSVTIMTPEPTTALLLGFGLAGLAVRRRLSA